MPSAPPASVGIPLDEVDTPALVLDLDALERNLLRMADAGNAADLDAAARAGGVRLDVLVEVNVGADRCGIAPGESALALARGIAVCRNLRFAGLHAYHGSVQHVRDPGERRAAIAAAAEKARLTKTLIENAGIACETVTGAGTGTFLLESASRVYNEIQPGSYVFMDADYNRNLWEEGWPQTRR